MNIEEIIDYLAKENSAKNNLGKLAEECAELLEVLLKCMTKQEDKQPKREKIIEELSHVIFRAQVYIVQNNLEDEITKDVSLMVVDFAVEDEVDEARLLWENQISDLKHVIGSI